MGSGVGSRDVNGMWVVREVRMIRFYRTADCPGCEGIEEALRELGVKYEAVVVGQGEMVMGELRPPVVVDGEEVVRGREAIAKYLDRLEGFREQWYKFQSDACYCDEEGGVE
jgi:hypothetical protein